MENKRHLDDSGSGSDGQHDKRIRLSVPQFTTETPLMNGNALSTQEQHSNATSPAQGQHSVERQPEEISNNGLIGEVETAFSFEDAGQINKDWQDWIQSNPDSGLSPSMLEPMDFQSSATPAYEMDSGFASGSAMGSCSPYPLSGNEGFKAPIDGEYSVADQTGTKEVHDAVDTCLGTILTAAMSSFKAEGGAKVVQVKLQPFDDIFKLYHSSSSKYAGLLMRPSLTNIAHDYDVKLEAKLTPSQPGKTGPRTTRLKVRDDPGVSSECPIRITIYCKMNDAVNIGNILSDDGLFLQHPSARECGTQFKYHNPHYFVRPGSMMPRLEDLSLFSDDKTGEQPEPLDEASKALLVRIFDAAYEPSSDVPAIEPSTRLTTPLKPHQLSALHIMSQRESGRPDLPHSRSLWEVSTDAVGNATYRHIITGMKDPNPRPWYGGILADEMGLGKTLSLLALICWSLDHRRDIVSPSSENKERLAPTLIVAPLSTIPVWEGQIRRHIQADRINYMTYHGTKRHLPSREIDIVLTTYQTLRSESDKENGLLSKEWFRVVLDEAHRIGNRSSQVFKATCALKAQRRWCLSGTPISNSLDNYGALLSFLQVPNFADKAGFDKLIARPVMDRKGPYGVLSLKALVFATCLRRTKETARGSVQLPRITEETQLVQLTDSERDLYSFFHQRTSEVASKTTGTGDQGSLDLGRNILPLINILRLICNHGLELLPDTAVKVWNNRLDEAFDWQRIQSQRPTCGLCRSDCFDTEQMGQTNTAEWRCGHSICAPCLSQQGEDLLDLGETVLCQVCLGTEAKSGLTRQDATPSRDGYFPSSKMKAVLLKIGEEQEQNHTVTNSEPVKSVIFSSWTKMLDLVQVSLGKAKYQYQRVDGTKSLEERRLAVTRFNEDPTVTIMLASISSAGEGIDLTAATHVHLLEPHWNPMAEAQAVHRVHRIGQKRQVRVTRYITESSIETYVQWLQEKKLSLIAQSLDSERLEQRAIDEDRWKKLRTVLACDETQ